MLNSDLSCCPRNRIAQMERALVFVAEKTGAARFRYRLFKGDGRGDGGNICPAALLCRLLSDTLPADALFLRVCGGEPDLGSRGGDRNDRGGAELHGFLNDRVKPLAADQRLISPSRGTAARLPRERGTE